MSLYKSFATVGGLTMVSRVLGFVRDILIAGALGSGAIADAFFVAFRFPNLFRRLFGEGAFNSAFVPLFAKRLEGDGEAAAKSFAEEAMSGLLLVLVIVSALAMLAMPWLMLLLAPGFATDPEKYDLAVDLTQIAFPYLTCMSLVALLSGVLNSMHRFWAAAAAPILLNVVLISAIGLAIALGYARRPEAGYVLAWGVFAAGLVQLAMLWIAVRRAGLHLRIRRPRYTEGVQRLVQLGIPGLISGGITQINIVVGTIIASLQAGAVSYLYYADRLYQLPLGIVGVAVGVVLLPDLARRLRAGDHVAAMDSQNRSLEFALLLTLPAAVALAVAAEPIIQVLFERGAFTATDTPKTAAALAAFAFGLPAFVLIKVFQPAFFAREDTKTPMRITMLSVVVNCVLAVSLFPLFHERGIATAEAVSGWLTALLLLVTLVRRGHWPLERALAWRVARLVAAAAVMAVVLEYASGYLAAYLGSATPLYVQILALGALVALAMVVYFAVAFLIGGADLGMIRRNMKRGGRPPTPSDPAP